MEHGQGADHAVAVEIGLGAGLNPTRLGADMHEACRTGCNHGGWNWD